MSKAFLIESSILHTESFAERFGATVNSVPFDGPDHLESEYRRQIRYFLNHLDHCTNYQRKESRWEDVTVPLPYQLGYDKLDLVFKPQSSWTRGLDALEDAGIIKKTKHDRKRGRCREFKIVNHVRFNWWRADRALHSVVTASSLEDYKTQRRGVNILHDRRGQRAQTLAQRIEASARRGAQEPRHDLGEVRDQRSVRARYAAALGRMIENHVNLDVLIEYMREMEHEAVYGPEEERKRNVSRFYGAAHAVKVILDRGIRIINESPLVVAYRPEYRVAAVGGRMFESGGAFQTLPGRIKFAAFQRGLNYDIRSSQLNILREVFESYSIDTSWFKRFPSVKVIARELDVEKKLAKIMMYGTLFSAGRIKIGDNNSIFRALVRALGRNGAVKTFERWKRLAEDLITGLKALMDRVLAEGRKSSCTTWTNAVGIRHRVYGRVDARARRQLLAHIIQGHETEYVLRTLEYSRNEVYALEHDGVIADLVRHPDYMGLVYDLKHVSNSIVDTDDTWSANTFNELAALRYPDRIPEHTPSTTDHAGYTSSEPSTLAGMDQVDAQVEGTTTTPLVSATNGLHFPRYTPWVRYRPSQLRVLSRSRRSGTLPKNVSPPRGTAPPRTKPILDGPRTVVIC